MRQLNARPQDPRLAYLLTLPLITLMTWLLMAVQNWMTAHEGHYVRAYGIAYLLPVAALTVIGGRTPGFIALAALIFALVAPRFVFTWGRAPDWAEMVLTALIRATLVFVLGSLWKAIQAAQSAERRVQEALVQTRSLADRQALLNRIGNDIRETLDPGIIEQRAVRAWEKSCGWTGATFPSTTSPATESAWGRTGAGPTWCPWRGSTASRTMGDAFVLYTDGLTESGRSRREMMGVAGLAGLLRDGSENAAALVAHLMAGVEAHARGVLTDDVCMLAGVVEGKTAGGRSVAANGER